MSVFFFGILPLIAFVVIDSFAGLKAGIIAAVVFALVEIIYSLAVFGTVDSLTIGTLVLVLVLGFISYKSNNSIYFKLQPVFVGVVFGSVLLVTQAMGKPLLLLLVDKYQAMLPDDLALHFSNPMIRTMFARVSGILGVGFLVHAALVAYAAFRLNNWWWLFIRGIGVYIMMIICVVIARLT